MQMRWLRISKGSLVRRDGCIEVSSPLDLKFQQKRKERREKWERGGEEIEEAQIYLNPLGLHLTGKKNTRLEQKSWVRKTE